MILIFGKGAGEWYIIGGIDVKGVREGIEVSLVRI